MFAATAANRSQEILITHIPAALFTGVNLVLLDGCGCKVGGGGLDGGRVGRGCMGVQGAGVCV